jgi:hypothetical protein
MLKNYISFFVGLVACGVLYACSSSEGVALLPIDELTGGNEKVWRLSYYSENGKDALATCYKDDTFTFSKTTQLYLWNKGNAKCFANDNNINIKFTLGEDFKTLYLDGIEWKITKLNSSALEIEATLQSNKIKIGYLSN